MIPKVEMKDLDREDEGIEKEKEGSVEPEQERLKRNVRALLREEMESSFISFGEDSPRYKQNIVNATDFKDLTQVLIDPKLDIKEEVEEESICKDDIQMNEMIEAADSEEKRNERSLEREPGFSGTRNPERIDVSGSEESPNREQILICLNYLLITFSVLHVFCFSHEKLTYGSNKHFLN
jgi:hypothetical protein